MKEKFDLIIFDWDGTLVDSIDWIVHCLRKTAERNQCTIPDEQAAKDIIGLSIQHAMDRLFPDINEDAQEHLIASYSQEFFSREITSENLFAGVETMLNRLRDKGYLLAVATGKGRNGLDKAIAGTGLSGFFDITRCADETASKPNPKMLEQILTEMKVDRARTVMIGDSIHDMKMADNAGIPAIAVSCGAHDSETLQHFNPILNLTTTTDLLNYF